MKSSEQDDEDAVITKAILLGYNIVPAKKWWSGHAGHMHYNLQVPDGSLFVHTEIGGTPLKFADRYRAASYALLLSGVIDAPEPL